MSEPRASRHRCVDSVLDQARDKPAAAAILVSFGLAIAVAIWFTTEGIGLAERLLLIVLGVAVVVGVGSGYLVDDSVDQDPSG